MMIIKIKLEMSEDKLKAQTSIFCGVPACTKFDSLWVRWRQSGNNQSKLTNFNFKLSLYFLGLN